MDHLINPARDIRLGMGAGALFFIGFLGWAAFIRLDAAAYASGTLVVSGQRQSVQHRDGGIVESIAVREGQRVEQGQALITLADGEGQAHERTLAVQAIRLLAQRARLESEQADASDILTPPEFKALSKRDRLQAASALNLQRKELIARRGVLAAQRNALKQRTNQSYEQGRGYGEQSNAVREQLRLIDEQIEVLTPMAAKGFVSRTRMRDLQRARAELVGQGGQYAASIAQARSAANESSIRGIEADRTYQERSAAELRDVETRLGEVLPRWAAARNVASHTVIRAPATGAVVGLNIFTPGGVIAPGQKMMDIVPEHGVLLIQARIMPTDVDDLSVGQKVIIRFPGLHERALPELEGRLSRLSADSLTDERTGLQYFTGDVSIADGQIDIIRQIRGKNFTLRAGFPVDVLIPLRKRTALDYLIEPLINSLRTPLR